LEKKFLSVAEAAKFSSLSRRFLYSLCRDRKLKYYKVSKRIVIQIADLQEFINEGVVEAIDWNEKARELRE